jgi:hypothetical protein
MTGILDLGFAVNTNLLVRSWFFHAWEQRTMGLALMFD